MTTTTKAAHTPGPWTYVRDCDYWEIKPTQIGGKDNYEGNEDDYRLIAAAPDLLEIARVAVELPHSADCSFSPSDPVCDCHVAEARAAVAKATVIP